jgi:rod shape-determining protein MreD
MRAREPSDFLPAWISVLCALALAIMPLPNLVSPFRPDWVVLVMIYWSLMTPGRLGLFSAFFLGLLLDTLSGALLGQHALALLVVSYVVQRFHLQIRVFPIWQMSMTVLALLAIYQFLLFWVDGVAGRTVTTTERWAPVMIGAALWPFILLLLENIREDVSARV